MCCGEVRFAGARPADEHHIVRIIDEVTAVQRTHQGLVDGTLIEGKAREVTMCGQARRFHLAVN